MNRQPVLEGERLLLRPLAEADWDALFAAAADPMVWELHPIDDRWKEPVFRAFFDDAIAQGGALVVIDKASDRVVGSSRFQGYDPAPNEHGDGSIEIGWTFLAREMWGGAANAEMKRLMLAHALSHVARVDFRVGEENWRSQRAMEKIGGRLTDRREELDYEGRRVVHVVYEITRESFVDGPLNKPAR